MKKLLVILCVVFLIFGMISCKEEDKANSTSPVNITASSGTGSTSSGAASVPEPATILLITSGVVGLVVIGRKKFFKKTFKE